MKAVFAEIEKVFEHLKQHSEGFVLPPGYAPRARKQFEKLLFERTAQGFVINLSIREVGYGRA